MYKDKFIAFVDILGFSDLVKESEEARDGAPTLEYLLDLTNKLGSSKDCVSYAQHGPIVCQHAPYLARNLDFRITQISDCVVVSVEVSPAGVINLLQHCFGISIKLLNMGHCCRGFVTRGNIFHTDSQFIGSGYMEAVKAEKKVSIFQINSKDEGTPFIEIDPTVCEYIMEKQSNKCVKDTFRQITESDGSNTAISPFLALKNSLVFRIDEDPEKCKEEIRMSKNFRLKTLEQLEKFEDKLKLRAQLGEIEVDESERARAKIGHYKRKITKIVDSYDELMKSIDQLSNAKLPKRTISDMMGH